ncbi:MAG: hypothetical protein IJ538_03550 [Clostridia bacterium]|nr:hypothetical protein [Clostridia bacterium]
MIKHKITVEQYLTVDEITQFVREISDEYEQINDLRKLAYIEKNINQLLKLGKQSGCEGVFGTGYPYYVLSSKSTFDFDENNNPKIHLKTLTKSGEIPIVQEQLRYNKELYELGLNYKKQKYHCHKCLSQEVLQNLKERCYVCTFIKKEVSPRKIINRLPDMDMWYVADDDKIQQLTTNIYDSMFKLNLYPSDISPMRTINDMVEIVESLRNGESPEHFLPIDVHVVGRNYLKGLIKQIPEVFNAAYKMNTIPYIPISPYSLRRGWEKKDSDPYNFVYDFLFSFSSMGLDPELTELVDDVRYEIATKYDFDYLLETVRRHSPLDERRLNQKELVAVLKRRIELWKNKGTSEMGGNAASPEGKQM